MPTQHDNPEFQDNTVRFIYKGADIEVRRYPGPKYDLGYQYFISINGDSYPYGVCYRTYGRAVSVAKRRVTRGDFETSPYFTKYGIHTLDDPKK